MTLDLTDEEQAALIELLRRAIDEARYPLSPRLDPAEGHSREIGTTGAEARTPATAAAGDGAEPRARKAETMKLPSLLRRPRAFCISTRNIIGLLFSMAGVVLLFCFALPNGAPGGPEAQ
jgi:hypothetical protein